MNNKGPFILKVLENYEIADTIYKMVLEGESIARNSMPGQFVSVKCADLTLRRPLSVSGVNQNTFDLIYKVKGTGTEYLANLKPGDTADVIGPMGNGYTIDESKKYLLIGCGVGIAPIVFMEDVLREKRISFKSIGCFRSKYRTDDEQTYCITEDGSSDITGRLNDHLENIIKESKPDIICICGPNPAMRYVTEIALQNNIDIEVALEGDMACGTNVCMGCAIKIKKGDKLESAKICGDGPVFKGEVITWG